MKTYPHGWTVSKLKEFTGMEGSGYNATLLRDGRPVAFVIDDASGGPLNIQWSDPCTESYDTVDYRGDPFVRRCTKEERLLLEYVATLPPRKVYDRELRVTDEWFVDDLVNDGFLLKQLRSLTNTKGKLAFVAADGRVYTIKGTDDVARRYVARKHPGSTVLNDLDELDAIAKMRPSGD